MIKRLARQILAHPLTPNAIIWKPRARAAGLNIRRNGPCLDLEKGVKTLRIRSTHGIYVPHMIENFDYYWNSVVPIREAERQVVDMSGPRHHQLIGFGNSSFLFPSQTEPYETTRDYLQFADLKEGQVVFDIGAYAGVTSIIFAELVGPKGHVYAFEADELNHQCAQANILAAGKSNITLMRKAIWSHNQGLLFSNEGSMGSSAVGITGGGRGKETLVPSTTLENFLKETGLEKVDFIKLDIEGAELEVLKMSAATLRRSGAKLIIEPHRIAGRLITGDCCDLLRTAGFRVHVREKTQGSEALIEAEPEPHLASATL